MAVERMDLEQRLRRAEQDVENALLRLKEAQEALTSASAAVKLYRTRFGLDADEDPTKPEPTTDPEANHS
jgi:outer membrane protein TolC